MMPSIIKTILLRKNCKLSTINDEVEWETVLSLGGRAFFFRRREVARGVVDLISINWNQLRGPVCFI